MTVVKEDSGNSTMQPLAAETMHTIGHTKTLRVHTPQDLKGKDPALRVTEWWIETSEWKGWMAEGK